MHYADLFVMHAVGDVITARLRKRHRFAILTRGSQPSIAPIDEPGLYEIDIAMILPGARLPAALMSIPEAHAVAVTNMPVAMVNDIIDQAVSAERGGHA